MKTISLLVVLLLVVGGGSGCIFGHHHSRSQPATPQPIITPDMSLAARVVSVNLVGRFVVLGFPPNQLPKVGQAMYLYRAGLKAAEVKITGPQQDNNIVADLVSGEAQVGDTVRDQ